MAKGLRSSVRKRNKTKLRATVYGPVVDARTARLSAKLQEVVSNPKPTNTNLADMQVDDAGAWFLSQWQQYGVYFPRKGYCLLMTDIFSYRQDRQSWRNKSQGSKTSWWYARPSRWNFDVDDVAISSGLVVWLSRLDMDLDHRSVDTKPAPAKKETAQPNGIKKKTRNKKRPSIAFSQHPRKALRISKRKWDHEMHMS